MRPTDGHIAGHISAIVIRIDEILYICFGRLNKTINYCSLIYKKINFEDDFEIQEILIVNQLIE